MLRPFSRANFAITRPIAVRRLRTLFSIGRLVSGTAASESVKWDHNRQWNGTGLLWGEILRKYARKVSSSWKYCFLLALCRTHLWSARRSMKHIWLQYFELILCSEHTIDRIDSIRVEWASECAVCVRCLIYPSVGAHESRGSLPPGRK